MSKDEIIEFLKANLRVDVFTDRYMGDEVKVRVKLLLGDEVIAQDYDTFHALEG